MDFSPPEVFTNPKYQSKRQDHTKEHQKQNNFNFLHGVLL